MENNIVDELKDFLGNVVSQGIQAAASKHAAIAYRSWGLLLSFSFSSEIHCNLGYIPIKGMLNVLYASMHFFLSHTHTYYVYVNLRTDEVEVRNKYIGEQT